MHSHEGDLAGVEAQPAFDDCTVARLDRESVTVRAGHENRVGRDHALVPASLADALRLRHRDRLPAAAAATLHCRLWFLGVGLA